jgi:hypothetical protein
MKLVAATLLTLLALGASVAEADQAGPKPSQPAPLPSWTGFYAGVNAGALWSGSNAPPPSTGPVCLYPAISRTWQPLP